MNQRRLSIARTTGRTAALLTTVALHLAWLGQSDASWALRLSYVALVTMACWRPGIAIGAAGFLAPLAATVAALSNAPFGVPGVLGALALVCVTAALVHGHGVATRLGRPALLMLSIVTTSAAAVAWFATAIGLSPSTSVAGALLLGGGVALAWSLERLLREAPGRLSLAVGGLLAGQTAASILTLREVVETASRSAGPLWEFLRLLGSVRTHSQHDVNAAASSLVLITLAGLGLARQPRGGLVWWILPLPLTGLWLTGGRVALAAILLVTAAVVTGRWAARRPSLNWKHLAVVVGVVLLSLAAGASLLQSTTRNLAAAASVETRLILWRTGGRMYLDAPVTGVGVGRFYGLSEGYGADAIQPLLLTDQTHENAHNYFIQILAELGTLGLASFLWLVWCVWPRSQRWRDVPDAQLWLLAGLGATMLTWLTSHPLLDPMGAFMFWMLAGSAAALTPAWRPGRVGRYATAILVLVVPLSIPWQASGHRDRAQLEHHGTLVSRWQPDVDGHRYRVVTSESAVFVPTGSVVRLPVRLAPDGPTAALVSVLVEGVEVNRVTVDSARWLDVELSLLPARRRFVEVRFAGGTGQTTLWVGRTAAKPLR